MPSHVKLTLHYSTSFPPVLYPVRRDAPLNLPALIENSLLPAAAPPVWFSLVQCILTFPKYKALPVNEYLDAVIIIQLSIKLPLLAAWHTSFACPKQVSRKRHPTMPALRAPLCCSPEAGRQKLADAQTVWRLVPPPAPLLSGTEWGTARVLIPVQVRDIPMIHCY